MGEPLLYPYQTAWINDKSRFKVAMFSRQTGKTFTSTLEIVLDCLEAEARGQRTRWVILSRGERQAKEAMEEGVKLHLNAFKIAFKSESYDFDATTNALEVILPHGSRITALPANPDTARGFSANVLLDEYAFHKDSRKIWAALFPVISAGYRILVISTPNGKGNKFHELMTSNNKQWSRHKVDIYEAVEQGLNRDIEQLKEALNDEDAWAQEFELKWLDEASNWLSFELITSCEDEYAGVVSEYTGGSCFVGVDIGIRNNLYVIWVIEQVGDVYWTREIIEERRASFAKQEMLLKSVFTRYHVVHCCMDQTGMGEKPTEDAKREYGEHVVSGVLFNTTTKLNMATLGKQIFEDRRIRIPANSNELRADLHKLKKVTGPTGIPRFIAESDSAGHADRAWACFLALSAAKDVVVGVPMVHSLKKKRQSIELAQGY